MLTSWLFAISLFKSSSLFSKSSIFLCTIFSTYYSSFLSFYSLSTSLGSWYTFIHCYIFSHLTLSSSIISKIFTFHVFELLYIKVFAKLHMHFSKNQMHNSFGILIISQNSICNFVTCYIYITECLGIRQMNGNSLPNFRSTMIDGLVTWPMSLLQSLQFL